MSWSPARAAGPSAHNGERETDEDDIPCGEVDFVGEYEAALEAEDAAEAEAEAEESESDDDEDM